MKPVRLLLPLALPLLLLACSPPAGAQSPAQKSFAEIKSLAGTWEGTLTTFPAVKAYRGKHLQVRLRVTSSGNALLHETSVAGQTDDPITMLYVDGNRLLLRHYCDAGNRPRMVAKASADGKTIIFRLLDVSGSRKYGYMEDAVFTTIDARHHTEDWTFLEPGNHPVRAHFDLHRAS